MALDPIKIPQNVYVEDRIIGPVTLRQIFLTLAGGGVSYVIYPLVKQAGKLSLITGILSWVPLLIMVAFAFLRIGGISLFRFLLLMAEKSEKPAARYWQPRKGLSMKPKEYVPRNVKEKSSFSHTQEEYDEIHKLSSVLDIGPVAGKTTPRQQTPVEEEEEEEEFITVGNVTEQSTPTKNNA